MNIASPRLSRKDSLISRPTAKLQLVTETLYRLDSTELALVVGGTFGKTRAR